MWLKKLVAATLIVFTIVILYTIVAGIVSV
jgi:hypothetical protein